MLLSTWAVDTPAASSTSTMARQVAGSCLLRGASSIRGAVEALDSSSITCRGQRHPNDQGVRVCVCVSAKGRSYVQSQRATTHDTPREIVLRTIVSALAPLAINNRTISTRPRVMAKCRG
jgi:hypothetical protein